MRFIAFLTIAFLFTSSHGPTSAQTSASSPIRIELVKPNFVTISNSRHQGNRIGYRFHEHSPIAYGVVPLSKRDANLHSTSLEDVLDSLRRKGNGFVYRHEIEKSSEWIAQDWTYYMHLVDDGIELFLEVRTHREGLPEYYGVQQCFRMSGETNIGWRKDVACTPAFSEYDLWAQQHGEEKTSLTWIQRQGIWQLLPPVDHAVGARTPLGMAVDHLRTEGELMEKVGPYEAVMEAPTDGGLITRADQGGGWLSGIYWERTSHVTDHHPADCIHSIVNIGNIPPFSSRIIRGKIYWFEGNLEDLARHHRRDFVDPDRLTIASCQFPVSADIDENGRWINRQIREATVRGADLVHFPECALSGYGGIDIQRYDGYDWPKLHSNTTAILALADQLDVWVLLGSSHPLSDGNKPHNSVYVIDPEGQILDRYDKRFCTKGDLEFYTPGDHFVQFKIGNIRCGVLICYDVRFPELYREYRKMDVDIIFQSFYNARHRMDCIHPHIMPLTAQARAATNYFYMSLTNSSAPFGWPCYFIKPNGLVGHKLAPNNPGILISEVDLADDYYDASRNYRMDAIGGALNSGQTTDDPRSTDRQSY